MRLIQLQGKTFTPKFVALNNGVVKPAKFNETTGKMEYLNEVIDTSDYTVIPAPLADIEFFVKHEQRSKLTPKGYEKHCLRNLAVIQKALISKAENIAYHSKVPYFGVMATIRRVLKPINLSISQTELSDRLIFETKEQVPKPRLGEAVRYHLNAIAQLYVINPIGDQK
jgi:hypothetical protein